MASISLCMIVRNEHDVLGRCLDSVGGAVDEIVIVDTGSTDDTRAIAARYTDRVFDLPWQDDFSAARNFAFDQATCDYMMWLDADDVMAPAERDRLSAFRRELDVRRPDMVMMKYCLAHDGAGRCTLWNWRERLIRRGSGLRWQGAVHEAITPAGAVERTPIEICHMPGEKQLSWRNLRIYEGMRAAGKPFGARDTYYYARELYAHGLHAEAARRFEEFLARDDGWSEDRRAACLLLGECRAALGDAEGELSACYRALELGAPRSGLCCALGRCYAARELWPAAEFWFHAALECRDEEQGFINEDERGFLPYIWLCVCRDRQGDAAGARRYNELAARLHPDDRSVQHNREYFSRMDKAAGEAL